MLVTELSDAYPAQVGVKVRALVESFAGNPQLAAEFASRPLQVLEANGVPLPSQASDRAVLEQNLLRLTSENLPLLTDPSFFACVGCKVTLNTVLVVLAAVIVAAAMATAPGAFLAEAGVALTISLALDIPLAVVTTALTVITGAVLITLEEFIDWTCQQMNFCAA